jgi:hypothetical protein
VVGYIEFVWKAMAVQSEYERTSSKMTVRASVEGGVDGWRN